MESLKRCALVVFVLLFMIQIVQADLLVSREVSKKEIILGDQITVSIMITNNGEEEAIVAVKEQLNPDLELINPQKPTYTISKAKIPVFAWNKKLAPHEDFSIIYIIKPQLLGKFSILPTTITDETKNELYFTNILAVNVLCIADNSCGKLENYLNCPVDCPSGSKDNMCDFKIDKKCDPDCETEVDSDCKEEIRKKGNEVTATFPLIFLNHPTITLLVVMGAILGMLYGIFYLFGKRTQNL